MKFMLLIHQGTTPTPSDPEAWARLSRDERRLLAIDAFVVAYFATPTDRLSDQERSGSEPPHEEGQ